MIDDLDRTLEKLLREKVPLPATQYEISFETPSEAWSQRAGDRMRANLYLYEVRENHELRDPAPRLDQQPDGTFVKRRAPSRIDLFYLVTTWSPARPPEVVDEHRLLSALLGTFLRYPTLPREYLHGSLVDQEPPLPTVVAQPDGGLPQPPAEFWSAIGNKLRPALNFVVTVAMEPRAFLDTPTTVLQPIASTTSRLGLGPEQVWRLAMRPPVAQERAEGEVVRSAQLGAGPGGRLDTGVFASNAEIRVREARDLRANEWTMIDDGDTSDFVRFGAPPGTGAATLAVEPPLRFEHATDRPLRRVTITPTAHTTLVEAAAAGATSLRLASGAGLQAGDFLALDEPDRTEFVRLNAGGGGGPVTLALRRPLRFDHPAGAGVKRISTGPPLTTLAQPANQPAATIVVQDRASFAPGGELAQGTVVMIGAGERVEFVTLGPVPAAPGRTIGVTPPLRQNHGTGTAIVRVQDGEQVGVLNRRLAAGDTEIDVDGAAVAALVPGAVVKLEAAASSYHQMVAAQALAGAIRGAEEVQPIGGAVTDTASPPTPIPGARVRLVELGLVAWTDIEGRFSFPSVSPGDYELEVTAAGYADETKAVRVPATTPDEYRVALDPA